MKKAQIMEIKDSYAIGFSDGEFIKLNKKAGLSVGDEIIFLDEDRFDQSQWSVNWKAMSGIVAACFAILIFAASIYMNQFMVYAVVTLDINPSVELRLNKQNEILSVEAMNQDGQELLDLDIEGLSVDEAIELLVGEAVADGFVDILNDDYVMITTVPLRDNEIQAEEIEAKITMRVNEAKTLQSVNIAIVRADKDELDQAIIEEKPLGLIAISDETDLTDIDTVDAFFTNEDNLRIFEKKNKIIYKYKSEDGQHVEVEIEADENGSTISVDVKGQGQSNGNDALPDQAQGNGYGLDKNTDNPDDTSIDLEDVLENEGKDKSSNGQGNKNGLDKDQEDDSDTKQADEVEDKDEEDSGVYDEESLESFLDKLALIQHNHKEVEAFVWETRTKLMQGNASYKEMKEEAQDMWMTYKDEWNEAVKDRDRLSEEDNDYDGERNRQEDQEDKDTNGDQEDKDSNGKNPGDNPADNGQGGPGSDSGQGSGKGNN